jgi:hypothetical protein
MIDVALEFDAPSTSTTPAPNADADAAEADPKPSRATAVAALLAEEDAFFRAFLRATKQEEALLEEAVCFPAVGEDGGEEGRFTRIGPNLARAVDVYTPAFVASSLPPASGGGGGKRRRAVRVSGSVGCLACVHEKESDQDGVRALKQDFIRSLRDRVHMLREEAASELEEGEGEGNDPTAALTYALHSPAGGVLRLPRRVLLPWDARSASSMLVADYLLPGEDVGEAVARVREVLGLAGVSESSVVFPEMEVGVEAAVGGGGGRLGRISSCNSLSMGQRAPSSSSLLLGRGHSCGSLLSLPRTGSVDGFVVVEGEGEGEEQPVSMDADEGQGDVGRDGADGGPLPQQSAAPSQAAGTAEEAAAAAATAAQPTRAKAKGEREFTSITSSPQLLVCMLIVGLAMVIGAALLHDSAASKAAAGGGSSAR